MVVPKCFIKHMCFIVLYFHGHAFFSLEIAKKCFFVLYFLKNVLYFCKLFKSVEYLFQVFIYNTKIGHFSKANPGSTIFWQKNLEKFYF